MQTKTLGIGAAAAALVMGCAIDDEELAEVDQAASWGVFYDWQRTANLPVEDNRINLGSNDDQSCFLAGIAGNIASDYGAFQGQGQLFTTSYAGVDTLNDRLKLVAFTGGGYQKLHARAMCFNRTAGRTQAYTFNSDYGGATKMAADDGEHVCFLRAIKNTQWYYDDDRFSSTTDQVSIFSLGGYWYLGGTGSVEAEAQCIKVQANLGEWNWTGGTVDIAQNDLDPGTQCFLTGYKGRLRTDDYSTGAFISYEPGLLQYRLTVSANRRAWARCVK